MSKPHCCPVCQGRGSVPNGFYYSGTIQVVISGTDREPCQSCYSSGIVWELELAPKISVCLCPGGPQGIAMSVGGLDLNGKFVTETKCTGCGKVLSSAVNESPKFPPPIVPCGVSDSSGR